MATSGSSPPPIRGKNPGSGNGEVLRRTQGTHPAPGVEHEQIVIAADQGLGPSRERKLQIFVVLGIAAIRLPAPPAQTRPPPPAEFRDALTPSERKSRRRILGRSRTSAISASTAAERANT